MTSENEKLVANISEPYRWVKVGEGLKRDDEFRVLCDYTGDVYWNPIFENNIGAKCPFFEFYRRRTKDLCHKCADGAPTAKTP